MHDSIDDRSRAGVWLASCAAATSLLALSIPGSGAGGAALVSAVASLGALVGLTHGRWSRRLALPERLQPWAVVAVVLLASVNLFGESWMRGGYSLYDWAPHHANLRHMVEGLRTGRIPTWIQGVSTGDSPFELYPWLPYYLAAKVAIWTRAQDLTLVLVRSGLFVHVLMSVGAGLLARKVVAWPLASLAGLAMLYDRGSVWGGGVDGIMNMGVVHSALTNALWPFVFLCVLDSLRRPTLLRSVRLWLFVAFAVACHPVGLVNSLATCAALVFVALLARDIPSRRAWFALAHVLIGTLLVAFMWVPFNERLLANAVHFSEPPDPAWQTFRRVMSTALPESSHAPLVYAGYFGVAAAMLTRRAAPTLLGSFVGVLFAGLSDQLYLLLDLAPSLSTARFQAVRLAASGKTALYACGVFAFQQLLLSVRPPARRLSGAPAHALMGALIALVAAGLVRGALPYFDQLSAELGALSHHDVPDPAGLRRVIGWAREQQAAMKPGSFARLLDEEPRHFYSVYHVNAESGLPTVWIGPVSLLFLRERIEDASTASLRRFNVRWVMRRGSSPALGDPASEKVFGTYHIRELPTWDGQFARVEQGKGTVVVTRLEDELVEVDVRAAQAPVLVALGMGYYPRWRATHADGRAIPVYASPSIESGKLHVPVAWLPPGKTIFRPTGALPSDGKGRALSALAILTALAAAFVWCMRGTRAAALRSMARVKDQLRRRKSLIAVTLSSGALLVALGMGFAQAGAPDGALQLGSGLRGLATVEARGDGEKHWRRCAYSVLRGGYHCPGLLFVQDSMVKLLNDAPPSPPFVVPGLSLWPGREQAAVAFRIRLRAKLRGTYWAATGGSKVRVDVKGHEAFTIDATQSEHHFSGDRPRRRAVFQGELHGKPGIFALVNTERLLPRRDYPLLLREASASSAGASAP